MRGGTGVLTSEDTSPVHPICGPGAACSHAPVAASHGWPGPAPRIMVGLGRVSGPHHRSGMAAYRCAGVSGARVAAHHRLHSRAHSSPTMRASHAVMEPRPMIHGGKRASCRCLENPPGMSWYGWGLSWGGHSRVPFTTRREATKSLSGRGGGGGWSPSAAVSHRCARAAALWGSRRSCSRRWLRSSHAKSPSRSMWWRKSSTEVPPGGSYRVMARSCASASSGTSLEQNTSIHVAPAERHEATHRALSPGGRWRAASCTAWR